MANSIFGESHSGGRHVVLEPLIRSPCFRSPRSQHSPNVPTGRIGLPEGVYATKSLHAATVRKSRGWVKYSMKVYDESPVVGGLSDAPSVRQICGGSPIGASTKKMRPTLVPQDEDERVE